MPKYICANTNIGQTLYKHLLARPPTPPAKILCLTFRNAQFSETKLLQNKFIHLTDVGKKNIKSINCILLYYSYIDLSWCLKSSQGEEPKNGVKNQIMSA